MVFSTTLGIAQSILADAFETPVVLDLAEVLFDEPWARSTVLRCHCAATGSGVPATVVVKHSKLGERQIFREWACLDFLQGVDGVGLLFPRLYAGSRDAELLVIEDLGAAEGHRLGRILQSPATGTAEAALIAHQRALARLHAATAGRLGEFQEVCRRHEPMGRSSHRVHHLAGALRELAGQAETMGVTIGPGAVDEVDRAIDTLARPAPFAAFTHGDPTPSNAYFQDGRIRLFDLEAGDFRHALVDGSFARLRYLHSAWAARIPQWLRRNLHEVYRGELASAWPQPFDAPRFDDGLIACAAGWTAGLCTFLPSVRDRDRPWGPSTVRQRIVASLDHFDELSRELDRSPRLGEALRRLAGRLLDEWGERACDMPTYKAFPK